MAVRRDLSHIVESPFRGHVVSQLGRNLYNRVHKIAVLVFHYGFPGLAHRRNLRKTKNIEVEVSLLSVIVDPTREAIDVGANVGHYAEQLAMLTPHVYAFEPHPRLARLLSAFPRRKVTVRQVALSDVSGKSVHLKVPESGEGFGEGLSTIEDHPGFEMFRTVRVQTATLDELADRNIGFVKIDVEGHELNVLAGAQQLIAKQRPTFLVEAEERHHAGATENLFAFFAERNYRGVFVLGKSLMSVESFVPAMQNVAVLRNDVPRKDFNYPNNFLFVPAERWSEMLREQIQQRLLSMSR